MVLLRKSVLRFGEDAYQVFLAELMDIADDREPTDELGDEPELEQVLGEHLREQLADVPLVLALDLGAEAYALLADPPFDELLEARESAPADEQDVGRVDTEELLVRMLPPSLGGHAGSGAFQDLEEGLLHPFARNVTRDGGVVGLARDLVDFIDVDDARSRPS